VSSTVLLSLKRKGNRVAVMITKESPLHSSEQTNSSCVTDMCAESQCDFHVEHEASDLIGFHNSCKSLSNISCK